MKRTALALIAAAFVALIAAPVLAGAPDFSSDKKISEFWRESTTQNSSGGGGGY